MQVSARIWGLLILIASLTAAHAVPPKTLVWEDLLPKFENELEDPLAEFELYRRLEVETIVWANSLNDEQRSSEDYKAGVEDAETYERELKGQGIDTDKLIRDYKAWQLATDERSQKLNAALDGKQVKLAGYLLPLQFSETGETEFLLVPYIGACIHAPVPPPNQIVFVETNQSFKTEDLYTPVWVTGTMKTKLSSKALSFVDGSADIPVGYTLGSSAVEIYSE
ncbi:MAG: DUF3299 domain-containing protein [Pseudomonadota bacterium]